MKLISYLKSLFKSKQEPSLKKDLDTKIKELEDAVSNMEKKTNNSIFPLKENDFNRLYPRAKKGTYQAIVKNLPEFGIDTSRRVASFISQCGHESAGFRVSSENLNYSANALANTWPSRYKIRDKRDPNYNKPNALAYRLQRNPEAIANNAYSNRMGNSTESSGEGWKYRGRGFIQLTGKYNYGQFQKFLDSKGFKYDIITNPELVSDDLDLCVLSALWYWDTRNLNNLADTGNVVVVTRAINGGTTGLKDRESQYSNLIRVV